MSHFFKIIATLIFTAALALALVSCATKSTTVSDPVDSSTEFSASGTQEVPEKWWTSFEEPALNKAVRQALSSNFNLKTAWQRLQAARAVSDRESAALLPSLDASAQAQTTENSSESQATDNDFQLGLTAVYEVDLWGSIRSGVEAEQYRAQASLADYQTAGVTLSAEVVRTWYQIAEAQNQLNLVKQQVETNQQVLELLRNRLGIDQVRGVDILRQKQLLESTLQQKSIVESRIEVLNHQLAVLIGKPPQQELDMNPKQLPSLPPLPQTGLPAELIQRRPDIRSAFNLLQAADRDLASAISNQYPRFSISASARTAADNAGNLFKDWALSLTGNLLAPLFYGGELSAEVNRSEAVKKQRLFEYAQTMLTAFREVEDALIREKKQAENIERLNKQVDLAQRALKQLRVQYFNGTSNYLDVLTARDEVQQLQRDLLTARLALVEYRIALYRSLAGSFEIPREK